MSDEQIYGVTGFPFSGKSSMSYGFEPLGYEVIEIGDHVKEIIEEYRSDGQTLDEAIESLPNSHIAESIQDIIDETLEESEKVVVSGIRSVEMERMLRQSYGAEIVSLESSYDTRRGRMLDNEGEKGDFTEENLHDRDGREARTGLSHVISRADHRVRNEDSYTDLMEEVLKLDDTWSQTLSEERDEIIEKMDKNSREATG